MQPAWQTVCNAVQDSPRRLSPDDVAASMSPLIISSACWAWPLLAHMHTQVHSRRAIDCQHCAMAVTQPVPGTGHVQSSTKH
jgi:hypothetical protein